MTNRTDREAVEQLVEGIAGFNPGDRVRLSPQALRAGVGLKHPDRSGTVIRTTKQHPLLWCRAIDLVVVKWDGRKTEVTISPKYLRRSPNQ